MKAALIALCCVASLLGMRPAVGQPAPSDMNVHWDAGSANCQARAPLPLQVHRYDANAYLLRESLCETCEGPFIYLLIDTGDIADANRMPLTSTVLGRCTR